MYLKVLNERLNFYFSEVLNRESGHFSFFFFKNCFSYFICGIVNLGWSLSWTILSKFRAMSCLNSKGASLLTLLHWDTLITFYFFLFYSLPCYYFQHCRVTLMKMNFRFLFQNFQKFYFHELSSWYSSQSEKSVYFSGQDTVITFLLFNFFLSRLKILTYSPGFTCRM